MPVLYLIACAAPPATSLHEGVRVLRGAGWDVWVTCTPAAAAEFVDLAAVAEASGHPARVESRRAGEPKAAVPSPDAVAVVPLTVNTLAKWALLINDSAAVGLLNELTATDIPILAHVWAKRSLREHPAFASHVGRLGSVGVDFLPANAGYEPYLWEDLRNVLAEYLP